MEEPDRITPKSAADYFEVITKAVFQSGMSWKVIESKWPGFSTAFDGFDPGRVAMFSPADVDRLAQDTGIVRNRRKIEATVSNANRLVELEQEHGGFGKFLASFSGFDEQWRALQKEFKFLGAFGAYYVLFVIGEEVPAHEDFRAQMGR